MGDCHEPGRCDLRRVVGLVWIVGAAAAVASGGNAERESRVALWQELNSRVVALQEDGRIHEAMPVAEEALKLARELFTSADPSLAAALANLAAVYRAQGRLGEAEALDVEAVAGAEKAGRSDEDLAFIINNLGEIQRDSGRLDEAERSYEKAVAIMRKVGLRARSAVVVNNLAELKVVQGHLEEGEELFRLALELQQRVSDFEPGVMATTIAGLAGALVHRGELAQAQALYERLLAAQEWMHGKRAHPDVATALYQLGRVYQESGRFEEAARLLKSGGGMMIVLYGDDHPKVVPYLEAIGRLSLETGDLAQAESYLGHAWRILGGDGSKDPRAASVGGAYAAVAYRRADLKEAESRAARALAVAERLLAHDDDELFSILGTLGAVLFSARRFEESESVTRRLVALLEGKGESAAPDLLHAYQNQAAVLRQLGREKDAVEVDRKLMRLGAKVQGLPRS